MAGGGSMTPEQKAIARAGLEDKYEVRLLMRNTYGTRDGKAALAMHMMESTVLETSPERQNPELAAHFSLLLYNLGINHPKNYTRIVEALMAIANDDDLDDEKARLAEEDTN